jgi:fibronectin type 3 domain-containing protein
MNETHHHSLLRKVLPTLLCGLVILASSGPAFAQTTKWKFIAVGDTRGTGSPDIINTPILTELASEIVAQGAQFVLMPGDLVSSGSLAGFQAWKSIMAPVYQAGIRVYPVMGNHDTADAPAYLQVFGPDLPANGPAGEVGRTYAFSWDNVLILGLDTELNVGRVNQSWVDGILAANSFPHIFVMGHRPAFKANHTDCLDDYPTERDAFWNSLKRAGATSYFCGHDHFYDHARVDDGDGNPNNDVHQLIVGCGGAPFHTTYAYDGVNTSWLPLNLYHEVQYGYTVVEVDGMTITMTFHHRTAPNTYVASSDVWTYTVGTAPTPPAPPTGLTATAGNATVSLTWRASTGATSYNVKRATGSPGAAYTTIALGLTAANYVDLAVVNGTTYYYVVTAVNSAGESASSAYAGATPQGPPAAPTNLKAVAAGKRGEIKLAWTASTGATSYRVKRSTVSGGPYALVKTVTGTSYTDNKLATGVYYYVVTALNPSGESQNSIQASAQTR